MRAKGKAVSTVTYKNSVSL